MLALVAPNLPEGGIRAMLRVVHHCSLAPIADGKLHAAGKCIQYHP